MAGKKETSVCLACQIVWEYPDWGEEHVSDMMKTYEDCGDPAPCTGDKLMDLCTTAASHKKAGMSYQETVDLMLKKKVR